MIIHNRYTRLPIIQHPGTFNDVIHHAAETGTLLHCADLRGAVFGTTNLSNLDFTKADLTGAVFNSYKLTDINFSQANLKFAKFEGTEFSNVHFTKANLKYLSIFIGTPKKVDFSGADLSRANFIMDAGGIMIFNNIKASKVNLRNYRIPDPELTKTSFNGATLDKSIIEYQNLMNADLSHGNFTDVSFSNTQFKNAKFTNSEFINCSFEDAIFKNEPYEEPHRFCIDSGNVYLSGCNLNGADLRNIDLRNFMIENCTFKGAKMENCLIGRAVTNNTDFSEAASQPTRRLHRNTGTDQYSDSDKDEMDVDDPMAE